MSPALLRARLDALALGRPVPVGETLALPDVTDDDRLVLAFVRMGGESLPWGVAYGRPGDEPTLLCVPEPRNRDLVAAMLMKLASTLDAHLGHPLASSAAAVDFGRRQLWLPGGTHLDMLHLVALRYAFVKRGDADRVEALRRLARAAGFLHREATRPGQLAVVDATQVLRDTWAIPAEDARQTHLGYVLAWLETRGGLDARRHAARAAEQRSVATTLDPRFENETLAPLVEAWGEASTAKSKTRAERDLRDALEPELRRRFELTVRAIRVIDRDRRPANPMLASVLKGAGDNHKRDYLGIEQKLITEGEAFIPGPETDHHSPAAAERFYTHLAAAEDEAGSLVHGDEALFHQLVESGDAFEATILEVVDTNPGRGHDPVWTLETSALTPLRLRVGARICPLGQRKRVGHVRAIERVGDKRHITLEIRGGKTHRSVPNAPDAHDAEALEGRTTRLVPACDGSLARSLAYTAWRSDGPGAWLTHAKPQPTPVASKSRREDLLTLVESLRDR